MSAFLPPPLSLSSPYRPLPTSFKLKRIHPSSPTSPSILSSSSSPSPPPDDPPTTPPSISHLNWREFRAALFFGSQALLQQSKQNAYRPGHWAHPLSLPEPGCFLASHPAYYRRSAPYLTQSVIFLTSLSSSTGATGLVLNRPLCGNLRSLEENGMFGRSSQLARSKLALQPVYTGGPHLVDSGVLTVLHGCAAEKVDVSKSAQVLDGVHVGPIEPLLHAVQRGVVDPAHAKLFAGCMRWKPNELETEVDEGSWFCIAASSRFALEHCLQLPKPLWVEIMQSQGPPFATIANQVFVISRDFSPPSL